MFLLWLVFLLVILEYLLRTTEGIKPSFTWGEMKKTNYSGSNISTYGEINLADCKKICAKNTSCKAIVRDSNFTDDQPGQCILKKELGDRWEDRNKIAYVIARLQ